MSVEPLVPNVWIPDPPLPADAPVSPAGDASFGRVLDTLGNVLAGATRAEDQFADGRGTLQAAVYERARADVALSVATATATRIAQAVQSVLNMQV
jgi:flagellar hook-basal body complex protein FliE